jgi:hypothetical protein
MASNVLMGYGHVEKMKKRVVKREYMTKVAEDEEGRN